MANKKYKQGQFIPLNKEKYVGYYPIVYRSSWELRFMNWCDINPSIVEWSSESVIIPYRHPLKKRICRYFPDFYIKVQEKSGAVKQYLIEIKPQKETAVPQRTKGKRAGTLIYERATYLQNLAKWVAAKRYCEERGIIFRLVTEKELLV